MYKKFTWILFLILCQTIISFAQANVHGGPSDPDPSTQKIVKRYPNPATTQINFEIQGNNDQAYEIIVYNFMGKKFDEFKVSGRTSINLDKYYSGIFIYQLRDMQGNVIESGKFNVIK